MHYVAFYNAQDCLTTKDHPVWDVIAGVQKPCERGSKSPLRHPPESMALVSTPQERNDAHLFSTSPVGPYERERTVRTQ